MIVRKYTIHAPELERPLARPVVPPAVPFGLGDAVAVLATPIARVLKMDCIDQVTKKLRPESLCAKRKAAMNAAGEKIKRTFTSKTPAPSKPNE